MPTWSKPKPKHNPFKCGVEFHLRKSGNLLAIYDLIGRLTGGGKKTFFSTAAHVARYFYPEAVNNPHKMAGAYETVRKSLKTLRKLGWLQMLPDGEQQWIHHDDWIKVHPNQCNEHEKLPWQIETDPLVGRLHAAAGGKIKIMEHHLAGLRKFASDDEIVVLFSQLVQVEKDKALRNGWDPSRVNRERVLYQTRKSLEERVRKVAAGKETAPSFR